MSFHVLARKFFKTISLLFLGSLISLGWWSLANAGNRPANFYLSVSLWVVLGGFLPALMGIVVMHRAKRAKKNRLRFTPWGILVFNAYPALITALYFSQLLTPQPLVNPKWFFHPVVLVFNLMAVLMIGPLGDCLGYKARVLQTIKAIFPTHQGKLIVLFSWWIWHLPFIFLNGSALSALEFSNSFLAGYLLTILVISYFLSWGYDHERRLVLFTAFKHY